MSQNAPAKVIVLPSTDGALSIVSKNALYASALGLLPVPMINIFGTSALQVKMLKNLANYYGQSFSDDLGKSLIASLLGGLSTPTLANGFASLARLIPVVGQVISFAAVPVSAGALTYAIGKVFVLHFGSGGNMFNFDPEKFRAYFVSLVQATEQPAAAPEAAVAG